MNKKFETGISAICSVIPVVGGPLSVIANDYFAERKEKRLYEFVQSIKDGLENKTHVLINDYINSEDFIDVLENTLRYVIYERQLEKRIAYQNILINSMIIDGTTYDDTEEFQHFVSILKVTHLKVLSIFGGIEKLTKDSNRDKRTKMIMDKILKSTAFEDPREFIELIKDLETYNLIDGFSGDMSVMDGGGGITSRDGSSITLKGERFLKYIQS